MIISRLMDDGLSSQPKRRELAVDLLRRKSAEPLCRILGFRMCTLNKDSNEREYLALALWIASGRAGPLMFALRQVTPKALPFKPSCQPSAILEDMVQRTNPLGIRLPRG